MSVAVFPECPTDALTLEESMTLTDFAVLLGILLLFLIGAWLLVSGLVLCSSSPLFYVGAPDRFRTPYRRQATYGVGTTGNALVWLCRRCLRR